MGDLWAGAEVHLLALLTCLVRLDRFECSVILFNEGRLAEELRKLPLSVSVISEKRHNPIVIAYRLAKIFRQGRPDIVHTHKYKDSILATMVARCVGVPHVIRVVHGMPEPFNGLRNVNMSLYTMVDRFVISRLVAGIIAVSSDIEQALMRTYGTARVVRIHNGIDLDVVQVRTPRSDKRKEWNFTDRVTLLGTVGRLVPVKGHAVLLEALQILQRSNRTMNLLIVGEGPLRGQLEAEVRRLGLEEFVRFAGHQVDSYDFINMMDVFVLPSLHEGIPMVLLEALALQRPVVATRVGGIPEVIEHGRTGLLAEPSDASSLARLIQRMVEDSPMAVSIGKAGRARVEEEFTARTMAEKTAKLYEQVLRNRKLDRNHLG
jgi:glycosyltransferase involved in cell wall biosynthesis